MATGEQLKLLVQAHYENEDNFKTIILQLAAYEATKGRTSLARDLKNIMESSKLKNNINFKKNDKFNELIQSSFPEARLSELIVSEEINSRLVRLLNEYRQKDKLKKYGLDNRRKILLVGPPGTGKTMTASVLATELKLPLYNVMIDKMVTKYMGETGLKLRQIFESIVEYKGVYLFDEFDAIGAERSMDNDVGEIRRILNSFLQLIEQDNSQSIIIAATNNHKMLDQALFRRFDDVIFYSIPTLKEVQKLIENRLGSFLENISTDLINCGMKLSHAEISKACDDAIKESILSNKNTVDEKILLKMIEERNASYIGGSDYGK